MWASTWVVFTNNGHYHPHTIICRVINIHHTQLIGFMSVLLQAQRAAMSSPLLAGGGPLVPECLLVHTTTQEWGGCDLLFYEGGH